MEIAFGRRQSHHRGPVVRSEVLRTVSETRLRRCAIYARKSTEEGLEQEFNSLEAQDQACASFIASQAHEGWKPIRQQYADGGYSGANMERPGLQRLLADIRSKRVDVVVVYKIDRLTRSLTDFARMVEVFEAHETSFVSVTQAFNTTTSMGRLTLNVLLSFAQFEREVTAERIRDKITASKKMGMWMGGLPPLGYDVQDRRLVVNKTESETVRTLFRLYLDLGAVSRVKRRADELGLVTKRRRSPSGVATGGSPFARGHLYALLSNPLYIGRIAHRGETHPGRHEPVVDPVVWELVQQQLAANAPARSRKKNVVESSLLAGLVYDETGDRLSPSHAVKNGRRYRYYISHRLMTDSRQDLDGWRLSARELERTVVDGVAGLLSDRPRLMSFLRLGDVRPAQLRGILSVAKSLLDKSADQPEQIRQVVQRIEVAPGELRIWLGRSQLAEQLGGGVVHEEAADQGAEPAITIAFKLRRRGVESRLVVADDKVRNPTSGGADPALVRLLAKAQRTLAEIVEYGEASVNAVAHKMRLDPSEVSRILPLAFLAPDIVEAILAGSQPIGLTANRLKRLSPLPADWADQQRMLGFS